MLKKLGVLILIFTFCILQVQAIESEHKTLKAKIFKKNQKAPEINKPPKNVVLLQCVDNKSSKSKGGGFSYVFFFIDGVIYDENKKLIKKQKITDSTIMFTYKRSQDYVWEKSRFTIDRFTGTYKSYVKVYDCNSGVVRRDAGICKQIKEERKF